MPRSPPGKKPDQPSCSLAISAQLVGPEARPDWSQPYIAVILSYTLSVECRERNGRVVHFIHSLHQARCAPGLRRRAAEGAQAAA
ncbi:hypothetical protein HOE425_332282 [Hoeflea sp. EC-HK425]|nr:hypothetical protein HOE425_332282 [Hoeflea sp. EC-HK425]